MNRPEDLVRTCRKLEAGLRFGQEGIRACQLGQFAAPVYWTADEAAAQGITKEMIVDKRRRLFEQLNDDTSDIPCKQCSMVQLRPRGEVTFSSLGHIDFAPVTLCNLRCTFCGYTKQDAFHGSKYDALEILRVFSPGDTTWDATVDLNGGEPALLPDLDEYLAFFASHRVRVLLYTNAVRYRQSIFDGLAGGAIRWVCTSLDAGTPSSFRRLKGRDAFLQVLENLARYASAGSGGGGLLAVKYIFCADNCTDDDISGFAYAMLAIRPQKIWLTLDFEPLCELPPGTTDLGSCDYSRQIEYYAKLYWLLRKHGLDPVHYNDTHLAAISRQGRMLMERIRSEISRTAPGAASLVPELRLPDARNPHGDEAEPVQTFTLHPLRFGNPGAPEDGTLEGLRVLIAPTSPASIALLDEPALQSAQILGFLDRDPVLWEKRVRGLPIYGYQAIEELDPDLILAVPPDQHRTDILRTLAAASDPRIRIAALAPAEV
jgi:Radical SAM superfamily